MAVPAAAVAAAQEAYIRAAVAQGKLDFAKIPTFSGNAKDDSFNAEGWVDRIEESRALAEWNNASVVAIASGSLRGSALAWFKLWRARRPQEVTEWVTIKAKLLQVFGETRTTKTTTATLHGLKQNPNERMYDWYIRAGNAWQDLKKLMEPAEATEGGMTAEVRAAANYGDIRANLLASATNYINIGRDEALDHAATQFFVAGMREDIRTIILNKATREEMGDLGRIFDMATEIEKNMAKPNGNTNVAKVDATDDAGNGETDVDAVRRGGHRGGRGGRGGRGRGRGGHAREFTGVCYHCNQPGHKRDQCNQLRVQQRGTGSGSYGGHHGRKNNNAVETDPSAVGHNPFADLLKPEDDGQTGPVVGALHHLN